MPVRGPATISDLVRHARTGEVVGFVAAPLLGWLLLRRVPLGQTFSGLVLGAIFGGFFDSWIVAGIRALVTAVLMGAIYRAVD